MILTVTLNPSVDRALFLKAFQLNDTNRVERIEIDAGGKGINVSRVYAELGGETVATGFLGGGPGYVVERVMSEQGVQHDFVKVEGETRINFSVEDESGDPPTTFNEPGPFIDQSHIDDLLAHCRTWAEKKPHWVCLCGSAPPGVPADIYSKIGEIFSAASIKIVLDADGPLLASGLICGPTLIKPNTHEAERLLGAKIASDEEAAKAAKSLYEKLGGGEKIALLSRGEQGCIMACSAGVFRGETPRVEARSSIGSGDSLIGAFLWALESGKSHDEALRWGMAAGAATATTSGSEIGRKPVIEKLFPQAKVFPA